MGAVDWFKGTVGGIQAIAKRRDVRLAFEARQRAEQLVELVRQGKKTVKAAIVELQGLARKDRLTTGELSGGGEYGHYVKAIQQAKATPSPTARAAYPTIGPDAPPNEREREAWEAIKKVENKEESIAAFTSTVTQSDMPRDRQQMWLDAGAIAAGLPVEMAAQVQPVIAQASMVGAWADLPGGVTRALVERMREEGIIKGARDFATDFDVEEYKSAARQGRLKQESYATRFIRELPDDHSPGQWLLAMVMGMSADAITDPLTWATAGISRAPALGKLLPGALKRAAARFVASGKGGKSLAPTLQKAALAVGEGVADLDAFYKARGVSAVRDDLIQEMLRQTKGTGRTTAQATKAVDNFLPFWQAGGRAQTRLAGVELISRPVLRDFDAAYIKRAKTILAKATEQAKAMIAKPEATEVLMREIKQRPPVTGRVRIDKLISPAKQIEYDYDRHLSLQVARELKVMYDKGWKTPITELAGLSKTIAGDWEKQAWGSLDKVVETLGRFFVSRGDVPSSLASPLEMMLGKQQRLGIRYAEQISAPVANLKDRPRQLVGELLGMHPRILKNEDFAETVGASVGELWGFTVRSRVEYMLKDLGIYSDELIDSLMVGDTLLVDKLPEKAKTIWTAMNGFADNMIAARKHLLKNGLDIGDLGTGYMTHRIVKADPSRLAAGMTPKQFFEHGADFAHPVYREWMGMTGAKRISQPSLLDPKALGEAYGWGMSRAELYSDLGDFVTYFGLPVDTLGKGEIGRSIGRLLGLRSVAAQADAQFILGAAKYPKNVGGLSTMLMPQGVTWMVDKNLTPLAPWMRTLRAIGAPARMSVLNSMPFITANVGDQFASAFMAGDPGMKGWANALRIANKAWIQEASALGESAVPRSLSVRLRSGAAKVGEGIYDHIDEGLWHSGKQGVLMRHIKGIADQMGVPKSLVDDIVKELLDSDILGSSSAAYLARHEPTFRGTTDAVLRNTVGWGVRVAGGMEDLAKSITYAALRSSGMSKPDAYRRLFVGFPHYSQAARSSFDNYMAISSYFWQYYRKRVPQLAQAAIERPWLMYMPLHAKESYISGAFSEAGKVLLEGRQDYLRVGEYLPSTFDQWPFSSVPEGDIPEKYRNGAFVPNFTPLRTPLTGGTTADLLRMLGLSGRREGVHPVQAFADSAHPYIRAVGYAANGNWDRTWRTAFPLTSRVERYVTGRFGEPPKAGSDAEQTLYKRYNHPYSKEEPPTPEVTRQLWKLDKVSARIRDQYGYLNRFTTRPQMHKGLQWDQVEQYNDLVPPDGQLEFTTAHRNQFAEEMSKAPTLLGGVPTGVPLDQITVGRMNDARKAGVSLEDMLENVHQQSLKDAAEGMSLGDWFENSWEDGTYVPMPQSAWREMNQQLQASKRDTIQLDQVRVMEGRFLPSSLPAMNKMLKGDVEWKPGRCQATISRALYGRGGFGNANEFGPYVERNRGWTRVAAGDIKAGDFVHTYDFPGDPEIGHSGFASLNPESETLELLSNYGGDRSKTFMPLPNNYDAWRPPMMSELELTIQPLR